MKEGEGAQSSEVSYRRCAGAGKHQRSWDRKGNLELSTNGKTLLTLKYLTLHPRIQWVRILGGGNTFRSSVHSWGLFSQLLAELFLWTQGWGSSFPSPGLHNPTTILLNVSASGLTGESYNHGVIYVGPRNKKSVAENTKASGHKTQDSSFTRPASRRHLSKILSPVHTWTLKQTFLVFWLLQIVHANVCFFSNHCLSARHQSALSTWTVWSNLFMDPLMLSDYWFHFSVREPCQGIRIHSFLCPWACV